MSSSVLYHVPELVIVITLFILMLVANWLGFYVKQRQLKQGAGTQEGLGSVEGSLLGLLALLLSFTFSMSASKNDGRKQIIIEEANDIGTVVLRCDLYPDSARAELRSDMQRYVEARIAYYEAGVNLEKIKVALERSNLLSAKIWSEIAVLSKDKDNTVASQQMIPAVNAMFDMAVTREAHNNDHVPDSILWLLFILTCAGSFIVGYGSKGNRINWIVVCGFALMMVMTIYLIVDLDRPRQGLINMNHTHKKVIELREMFKK